MKTIFKKNIGSLLAIAVALILSTWTVRHFHKPGQLDVISAQAMDMSQMRPPVGSAIADLAQIKHGSLADTVTYTGSVLAFNEQEISPRVTGRLISLPVYPGDTVHAGELVAQLDTAELAAKTDEAVAQAREAKITEQVAILTHHLHHKAALDQASAQIEIADQDALDAQDRAQAARDEISEADAEVQSSQANARYWNSEITREKQLLDAGAVSRQDYQNELAQSQTVQDTVTQALAKARKARAMLRSALDKASSERKQILAAQAGKRMAEADLIIAQAQAQETGADAAAAQATAREAAIVQGYTRIVSPSDGVVTARPVAPGTLVQPGTVILNVAEIDKVRVQANVAVTDIDGVGVGSPVRIDIVGGSGAQISARVTAVFPSANDQSRTAVVEAVILNPGHKLLPGAFVTMHITKAIETDKMLVPAEAVSYEEGQPSIWIARGAAPSASDAIRYRAVCGFIYSAADAKKYHYICPMDHHKLVPIVTGSDASTSKSTLTAHRLDVEVGGSDGAWTEVNSSEIQPGDQVVRHGQAGLTEGAQVIATEWSSDGPKTLPTMAQAAGGETRYRCVICGLTFSAADAKKDGYHDPMDGGKLVPIQ